MLFFRHQKSYFDSFHSFAKVYRVSSFSSLQNLLDVCHRWRISLVSVLVLAANVLKATCVVVLVLIVSMGDVNFCSVMLTLEYQVSIIHFGLS